MAIIGNVFNDSRALPFKDFLDQVQLAIANRRTHCSIESRLVGVLIVHQMRQNEAMETERNSTGRRNRRSGRDRHHPRAPVCPGKAPSHYRWIGPLCTITSTSKNRLNEELRLAQRKVTSCCALDDRPRQTQSNQRQIPGIPQAMPPFVISPRFSKHYCAPATLPPDMVAKSSVSFCRTHRFWKLR